MKCVCDKSAKAFHCYGEGYVHEIKIIKGETYIKSYVCSEDIDTVIVNGEVFVIRSTRQEDKEYIWVEVFL